jgi:hypothetical protein
MPPYDLFIYKSGGLDKSSPYKIKSNLYGLIQGWLDESSPYR